MTADVFCAYARNSDRHQETSVEQQIEEFRRFASLNALTLYEPVFCDRSKSGTTDAGRTGIDELMAFLERRPRPVKGVLLWASSRMARNVDDSAYYKASIRRAGYKIVYLGDELLNTDGPERHVFESLYEFKDARYSLDLARDVRRGMLAHAEAGQIISRAPRGYVLVAGHWAIDPLWEAGVRKAWEMRSAGYSLADIHDATHLYTVEYGYFKLFRNKTYTGTFTWAGQEFENFCPALCTPEQWQRVQVINAQTMEHPRRVRSVYLLSGRVFCKCGAWMKSRTQIQGKHTYRYYSCRRSPFQPIACGQTNWRCERLEAEVVGQALTKFTPDQIGPLYAQWQAQSGQQADLQAAEHRELAARLAVCRQALDNLMRAVEQGAEFQSVSNQIAKREAEMLDLQNKIATLPPAELLPDLDIETLCANMAIRLQSDNLAEKRLALRSLVARVTVSRDDVHVELRSWPG